jgi:hypothetical protein
MKCFKFNSNRSADAIEKYRRSWDKTKYMARRNKSQLLDSLYFENQTWGALHKAWKGFIIGKNKDEVDRMAYYAGVIQKLQRELGLQISIFPELKLVPLDSFDGNAEFMPEEISEEEAFDLMVERDAEDLRKLREDKETWGWL